MTIVQNTLTMHLLDPRPLATLQHAFRLSMRRLYADLCRELRADHVDLARELRLPTGFLNSLRSAFPLESYSNWKVVGWIEALNDLVYLLDLCQQLKMEHDRSEFVAQLFDECQEKFFEHGYFDDLFPRGRPQARGLETRLFALCRRLAGELTQESLWLDPGLAVTWMRRQKKGRWEVPGSVKDHFEKAELPETISTGLVGAWCQAPHEMRQVLSQSSGAVAFHVESSGISMNVGRNVSPIWSGWGKTAQWQWAYRDPVVAVQGERDPVTVGPTLAYGKHRQPRKVLPTDQRQVERITCAWETIRLAWPEGHDVLALLSSRIIPLKAKGVVSFSYRHRPGLSFINCFDRDNLDLIDDLIHENSHHHLNLLLRKQVMYRGDHNQQIFYSPWRRSLRPLRGILHATFTFTMGALLFQRLSAWGAGRGGSAKWKQAGLSPRDLQRARFRCLEEVESVRYSLLDLQYADERLGWLTSAGRTLVQELAEAITHVERISRRFRQVVEQSSFGPALRRHVRALHRARHNYGLIRTNQS
ncbi:MAG TPA: HEXXH motif-containing putative peptide modification protein [Nitrospira sp.]|nr:HEXXH motif-containing putative peptide modification protein [Nitrospira sp.]